MKAIVVGLGTQGNKRVSVLGDSLVATVDPVNANAQFKHVQEISKDSFDCAFVCTPEEAKFEILSYLLNNKKHLLVEKPLLADDPRQLEDLHALAEKNGVACYTAYNHRFEPSIEKLKQTIVGGRLGKIYAARLFYGNGTARNVRDSKWRDKGTGVLHDLGSHLIDLSLFLFGVPEGPANEVFEAGRLNRFENKAYDHVTFTTKSDVQNWPQLQLEATLLSWKNSFSIDVFGELGTAHSEGLLKWGPSRFEFRKRVFPSGRPEIESETIPSEGAASDVTWAKEYAYFKKLCSNKSNQLENDLWINSALKSIEAGA